MRRSMLTTFAAGLFLSLTPALAEPPADLLGIPGPLHHDGAEYALAWSDAPSTVYRKQEYLPEGQQPDSYRSMILLEFVAEDISPAEAAATQAAKINARKGSDPVANFSVLENKAKDEQLLDFLISGTTETGEMVLEWNAYRYFRAVDGQGRSGLFLFAISHRAYGEADARRFLEGLKVFRLEEINRLAQAPPPEM